MDFSSKIQAYTYCIKRGYAFIIVNGIADNVMDELSYDEIFPIVQDGMLIYEKDNLRIYKFSNLINRQKIEYFKQVMKAHNIKNKDYDSVTFANLFKLKKTIKVEDDEINPHKYMNTYDDDAKEVFRNEHYVIYKDAKYKLKSDCITQQQFAFKKCYKLVFLKINPNLYIYDVVFVRDKLSRKKGFYFNEKDYSLEDVRAIADREVDKYLQRKTKKSSIISQLVKIARSIMAKNN